MSQKPLTVALVGNPNAGKSTLFNALSGLRQHVGNYPGVTVEMKKGQFAVGDVRIELIDLPGTYSLAARSPDEMVAVDLLLGRRPEEPRPDVVLSIVDASNLDRHLYLTSQLLELGVPVVLAVNMVDVAADQGITIDFDALSEATGLAVVPVQANQGVGLDKVRSALVTAAKLGRVPTGPDLPAAVHREAEAVAAGLDAGELPPVLARRVLFDIGGYVETWLVDHHGPDLKRRLTEARERLKADGCPVPAAEAKARFAWVRGVVAKAVTKPAERPVTATDRIDKVLTHRVWGTAFFLAVMFLVFQAIYVAADPLMGLIEEGFGWLSDQVKGVVPEGPLQALLTDGIVGGVGGVIVFLPQIVILFAFLAVLEDCGYMARAAFLMDRIMSRCGLSGKSFIPLLSSVACAIPGVMATRVIENRRDRLATIVVAPLMSCSARLPVYALLIGAFLTDGFAWWVPGLTLFGMYAIGFVVAPLVALALRKTLLRGETPLFVMELPAYKRPSLRAIVRRMAEAGWAFLRRAGTIILAATIVVWALLYFPDRDATGERYEARIGEETSQIEAIDEKIAEQVNEDSGAAAVAGLWVVQSPILPLIAESDEHDHRAKHLKAEWQQSSYLGRAGKALEPAFRPLGWDWKIGMAALASFPAREVIVGTLGIIYEQGEDIDTDNDEQRAGLERSVREEWAKDPVHGRYGVPVALSVMVFFALCCQCAATLAVIRRETKSWAWPAFTFAYMTTLAYIGAFVTFQIGAAVVDALG